MEREIIEREIELQRENIVVGGMPTDDYYTKEETDTLLEGKANVNDIPDISGLQEKITTTNKLSSDLIDDTNNNNLFVSSTEKTTWNNKQNTLTFDNTPTANSTNPVTSNGIKTSIDTKLSKSASETEDNTTYENSITLNENNITSGIEVKAETDTNNTSSKLLLYPDSEYPGATLSVARDVNGSSVNSYIDTWFDDVNNTFETDISAGTVTISSDSTQISGVPTPTNSDDAVNKQYVDNAIASVGGGDTTYLGKMSEHNTSSTAINLNDLDVGVYVFIADVRQLNLKATYNGNVIEGYFNESVSEYENQLLYLIIEQKVEDITTNTRAGYVCCVEAKTSTGNIIMYKKVIRLYDTSIDTSIGTTYSFPLVLRQGDQTIYGTKSFENIPTCSVVPTSNSHLVNKKYVDDCIGTALGGSY